MNKTVKFCDSCNSPVVTVKKGKKITVECSYCGKPYAKEITVDPFMPEYTGEEDEV
ncbi:MAG TPA: hypothetical protein VK190_05030 [Pseudoneobacillus sp.]|nr:hypothetical protein [Pseudoneobacillus sp.]